MRQSHLLIALVLAAIATLLATAQLGAADIPAAAWLCSAPDCAAQQHILLNIRLPRAAAAMLTGAMLAVSGAAMQGIFRNPLIDPGIIGVTSGAGLAAALYLVLLAPLIPAAFALYGLPLAAFAGSWLAAITLYTLSRRGGETHTALLLLIGIAFAALTGAATGLLTYLADDNQLRSLTFWAMGSLAGIRWPMAAIMAGALIIGIPLILASSRALNALTLGEAAAEHMGFSPARTKQQLIFAAALLTGTAAAFTGGIGFVGLAVPHLVRLVTGSDHRRVLPASILAGAILLGWADTGARLIAQPAELPIGILTAFIGAPVLAVLVWKNAGRL